MKSRFCMGLWLVLTGLGCSSTPAQTDPAGDPSQARPEAAQAGKAEPQAQNQAAQDDRYQKILKEYEQSARTDDDRKKVQAESHFKLAQSYFLSSDFNKSELEARRALELDPGHEEAKNLLQTALVLQGKAAIDPQSKQIQDLIHQVHAREEQVRIEVKNAYYNGVRQFSAAQYEESQREFERVLEIIRVLPPHINMDEERKLAEEYLEKSREAVRIRIREEEELRQRMISEEEKIRGVTQKLQEFRKLEIMFGQAMLEFEKENYPECVRICEKIMYIDPNLKAVKDMRQLATRLSIKKEQSENLARYVEEWKRTFEKLDTNSIIQRALLEFPEKDVWEQIQRRGPKTLHHEGEEINKEDKEIQEKLKSQRITVNFTNIPLSAFVDYLREYLKPINFHLEDPASADKPVSVTLKDIPVENLLNIVLEPMDLGYYVKDGIVFIANKAQIQKQLMIDIYDVADLTFGINDFPGMDISLTPTPFDSSLFAQSAQQPAGPRFDIDMLTDLIKKSVDPKGWEDGTGKSVESQNGVLIVKNTHEVHKMILQLLSDLRRQATVVVNVQVRFLVVQETFLEDVGIEFRDLDGARAQGILTLDDIVTPFMTPPPFMTPYTLLAQATGGTGTPAPVPPGTPGPIIPPLDPRSAGISGVFGGSVPKSMGARVQHILWNDQNLLRFSSTAVNSVGGLSAQFTLLDDVSLEALLRAVRKQERSHTLLAPNLTLFNGQRANLMVSNQLAYVRDYDPQILGNQVIPDPIIDVVNDGVSLDIRPIVSFDRKYITIELRPTVAVLTPPPPAMRVVGTALGNIEAPQLEIQRVRTTVTIPDRGTMFVGGLGYVFEEDTQSGIPFLKDIPLLGSLASQKVKAKQRRQHVILLRATVIIPEYEEKMRF